MSARTPRTDAAVAQSNAPHAGASGAAFRIAATLGGLLTGIAIVVSLQALIGRERTMPDPPTLKLGEFSALRRAVSEQAPVVVVVREGCTQCPQALTWFAQARIPVQVVDPRRFDALANGRTAQVSPLGAHVFPLVFADDRVVSGFHPQHLAPLRRHAAPRPR